MWSIAIIILQAFFVRSHAKELVLNQTADMHDFMDTFANKLVDKLVDKLLANMVAVPQTSRPAIPGRTLPSPFAFPLAAGTALAPHVRYAVVPNAVMNEQSSKQPSLVLPGKGLIRDSRRDWPMKYRSLFKRGLKPVTPKEALKMTQTLFFPAKLVDIRLESQFATAHPQGAINVPLFQIVQGNSVYDWTKRLISYSTAVEATEQNPEFQAEALEQLKRNQPIIIVCDRGGTMENLVDDAKATEPKRYTASLKAASELYEAGFKNLFFLEGGISEWDRQGFPVAVDNDLNLNPISSSNLVRVLLIPAQIPIYFVLVAVQIVLFPIYLFQIISRNPST